MVRVINGFLEQPLTAPRIPAKTYDGSRIVQKFMDNNDK